VGWPHSGSGRFGEDKNFLPLPVIKPRKVRPSVYSLCWLSYPGFFHTRKGTRKLTVCVVIPFHCLFISLSSVSLDSSRKFQLVHPSLPTPRKQKIQQVTALPLCYYRSVVRSARHLAVCLQYFWPFVPWSLREDNSHKEKEATFRDFIVRSAWRPSEWSVTQNNTIWFAAPQELVYKFMWKDDQKYLPVPLYSIRSCSFYKWCIQKEMNYVERDVSHGWGCKTGKTSPRLNLN
jgi:hypothetical protein